MTEDEMETITAVHRSVAKQRRGRWIYLAAGVALIVMSLILFLAGVAHAAMLEPVAATVDVDSGKALVDAVASSGPAAGAVLILAYFLRAWQGDIKLELAQVKAEIKAAANTDNGHAIAVGKLQTELDGQKSNVSMLMRRLESVESQLRSLAGYPGRRKTDGG